MSASATARRSLLLATLVVLPLGASCSSDDATGTSGGNPLVATWQVTSFQALGTDFIARGMTMKITFATGGTYTIVVTGDLVGTCNQATSCTETGNYTSTSTQITIGPGTADEVTFSYSIQGTTMTFTGSIDGNPVTMVLKRQ